MDFFFIFLSQEWKFRNFLKSDDKYFCENKSKINLLNYNPKNDAKKNCFLWSLLWAKEQWVPQAFTLKPIIESQISQEKAAHGTSESMLHGDWQLINDFKKIKWSYHHFRVLIGHPIPWKDEKNSNPQEKRSTFIKEHQTCSASSKRIKPLFKLLSSRKTENIQNEPLQNKGDRVYLKMWAISRTE